MIPSRAKKPWLAIVLIPGHLKKNQHRSAPKERYNLRSTNVEWARLLVVVSSVSRSGDKNATLSSSLLAVLGTQVGVLRRDRNGRDMIRVVGALGRVTRLDRSVANSVSWQEVRIDSRHSRNPWVRNSTGKRQQGNEQGLRGHVVQLCSMMCNDC